MDKGDAEKAENHIESNVVDVPTSTSIPSTSDQTVPDVPASWRRQRPKPHYHGMKKKKLQELCKVEGLSTSGGEKELKERHTLYLTLWNSECDARVPRKRNALLQEISKRETAKKVRTAFSIKEVTPLECHVLFASMECLNIYLFTFIYVHGR